MARRHSKTERLGILASDTIFTREFDWIFREQPLVDVGIDALVEKSDEGDPAGKFIALQIKSGEKNIYQNEVSLTLYVENVHRYYWLGLNVPILLVVYLPEGDKCYWEIINDNTLQKTDKKSKIVVQRTNILDVASKPRIEKYLANFTGADSFSETYKLEYNTNLPVPAMLLQDSKQCVVNINRIINELDSHFRSSKQLNESLRARGVARDSLELKSNLTQQARTTTSQARRLVLESGLFSESFAGEYLLLEKYLYSWIQRSGSVPEPLRSAIMDMPSKLKNAMNGTEQFRDTVFSLKNTHAEFSTANSALFESLEVICAEYEAALELIIGLCASLDV